jgi:hypothetical protein
MWVDLNDMSPARRWSCVIGSIGTGFVLTLFAFVLADRFGDGVIGTIISPGSALCEFLDKLWPVQGFGVGVERFLFGSFLIDTSGYALLAYLPIKRLIQHRKNIRRDSGDAFWLDDWSRRHYLA